MPSLPKKKTHIQISNKSPKKDTFFPPGKKKIGAGPGDVFCWFRYFFPRHEACCGQKSQPGISEKMVIPWGSSDNIPRKWGVVSPTLIWVYGQPLIFFGGTYLVGKIKFKLLLNSALAEQVMESGKWLCLKGKCYWRHLKPFFFWGGRVYG